MKKTKAAVFASGTGSNFQAIMEADNLPVEVVLLVCDKAGAKVMEKAAQYGVPVLLFDPKAYASKSAYEQKLIEELEKAGVEWIFLAGYMRIVGPDLLGAFEGRIVNIHPSLLPAFPGKDAIGQAYQAGVDTTGVTVHYIDEGIDTGPIIAQESVGIHPEDTEDMLKERIQQVEHNLYPNVIRQLLNQTT
ncbi:phosphoribosylglycinamide formyltransferase [Oceanobacillus manasiensis]|uniref:phosphoribosylglycinamide formyltransferase n=1 Tax=Oceanobacillus manasiensis TaxID=586413 RepID=UPI0005A807A3|nr:phosphoribosylglycinamide formyltransferase [Oceanobacillus manasiensis]